MSFQEDGYWVARGILDPIADVQPLQLAVHRLVDELLQIYGESAGNARFGKRLALLLEKSRGRAMDHIDPVLNLYLPDYKWQPDYPTAQVKELFQHMRNAKILDVLEQFIGPEIAVSPIYHFNLKLGTHDRLGGKKIQMLPIDRRWLNEFQTGRTGWHADAHYEFQDAHNSDAITVWTPLSRATRDTSCLQVIPGSHHNDAWREPPSEATPDAAVSLETQPGDVVFMDHRLLHAAPPNRASKEVRYSCNVRYLPIGQANGRPFLPGFIARSHAQPDTELADYEKWRDVWAAALQNLVRCELPLPKSANLSLRDAEKVTQRWKQLAPDEDGWLRLRESPSRPLPIRLLRRSIATLRLLRAVLFRYRRAP